MKQKILYLTAAFLLIFIPMTSQECFSDTLSDKTISGFVHPESVACDTHKKVLYVGQFGSVMEPLLKDGKGKISRLSFSGEIIEENFLPLPGQNLVLHKPKGIWVENQRLWVADIDTVAVFDLSSRRGKKISLPDSMFANDPVVMDGVLYVSDTVGNRIYRIAPADFLDKKPEVTDFISRLPFAPNGLYPGPDGTLLVAGFEMDGTNRSVYSIKPDGSFTQLTKLMGLFDGIARLDNGSLLITDWKTKSIFQWSKDSGRKVIASRFMGPADFCVVDKNMHFLIVVPDLIKSELRFIRMSK